jgi:hypothetical protein
MGKRDELDVVAVCRQEEETHTPKRLAPVTNFFFFFCPAAAAGGSHNISIQEVSHANRQKLYYFGNHFNFNFEFNRI